MPSGRIPVSGEVLLWARTSAGFSLEQAAKKIGVSPTSLQSWERAEKPPTITQLRNAAAAYRRPLAVLLLPSTPKDFQPLRDFRRLPSAGEQTQPPRSPELNAEFRRAMSQREVFLELLELTPGSVPEISKKIRLQPNLPAEDAGAHLRDLLGMGAFPNALWLRQNDALNDCVAAVEGLGVLVIQTHRVTHNEMRGFSISEWPFPAIALNGGDWPRPKLFTLLHELCHLALNAGGLCDLHERRGDRTPDDRIEHYCNEAAASALMPRAAFLSEEQVQQANQRYNWSLGELRKLSARFGASSEAALLRLISVGKATWSLYWELKPRLEQEYADARQGERERQRQAKGGPSFYVIKARDLGHRYVASVLDAFRSRAISSLDVADYLEVRFDQLPNLEAVVR
jgi:Zn-dependent peptidase ImmA (M78 family)/transcriptional regulator with XRE-family HTH domain